MWQFQRKVSLPVVYVLLVGSCFTHGKSIRVGESLKKGFKGYIQAVKSASFIRNYGQGKEALVEYISGNLINLFSLFHCITLLHHGHPCQWKYKTNPHAKI